MITRRNQRVTSSAAQALLLLLVLGCRMLLLDPSIVMGESAAAASSSASAQNRRSLKVMEPFTVETKPAYRAVKEPVSSEDVSLSDQRTDSTVAMLKVPNLVAPPREDCSASGPCELCTDSDRDNTPECLETGRRQSFLCFVQGTYMHFCVCESGPLRVCALRARRSLVRGSRPPRRAAVIASVWKTIHLHD